MIRLKEDAQGIKKENKEGGGQNETHEKKTDLNKDLRFLEDYCTYEKTDEISHKTGYHFDLKCRITDPALLK